MFDFIVKMPVGVTWTRLLETQLWTCNSEHTFVFCSSSLTTAMSKYGSCILRSTLFNSIFLYRNRPCPWLFSKMKLTGMLARLRAYCQEGKNASKSDGFYMRPFFCIQPFWSKSSWKRSSGRAHNVENKLCQNMGMPLLSATFLHMAAILVAQTAE